jgi:hypothetical protein
LLGVTYQFDLTAADYREMNLAAFRWPPVLLHYSIHALSAALLVLVAAPWALEASTGSAAVAASVVFVAVLAWLSLAWRAKALRAIDAADNTPSKHVIFGPHTLTFTDAGLESTGPVHRSFRDWRAVTEARITKTQMLIYTAFGVVYILPLRAVPDLPALEKWLAERSSSQPNKSFERTREG